MLGLSTLQLGFIGCLGAAAIGFGLGGKFAERHERAVTERGEAVCAAARMKFVEYGKPKRKGEQGKALDRKRWGVQCADRVAQLMAEHDTALDRKEASAGVTAQVGQQAEANQVRIETRYRTIQQKVPIYVPQAVDDSTVVPVGLVRLLDAAAAGQDPDGVSFAAGRSHEAASGVKLSTLSSVVAGNYGVCNATRQQLIDFQSWARAQEALNR
jgi:hypothetical protein